MTLSGDVNNNENCVAHYTTLDTAISFILPDNKIKVSSIKILNDPYENSTDWFDSEIIGDKFDINHYKNLDKIQSKLNNLIKVFSTTTYRKNNYDSFGLSNQIYCRPRMWAQYGDNHKGVCLIFDKKKLHKEFVSIKPLKLYADKIEYLEYLEIINNDVSVNSSELPDIFENSNRLCDVISKNNQLENRFFRKHSDWQSESEYRWLLCLDQADELFLDFGDSLKAIVFGCNVHRNYFNSFKNYDIPLYALSFKNGKYTNTRLK